MDNLFIIGRCLSLYFTTIDLLQTILLFSLKLLLM